MDEQKIQEFADQGVTLLRGLLCADEVRLVERAVEANMRSPSEHAAESCAPAPEQGSFFDDYVNWQRIEEIKKCCHFESLISAARQLLNSEKIQLFHDHVLVKEPGTSKETPWHQDAPYYFVDEGVSFWIPVDTVRRGANTLRFIGGSHRWQNLILPVKWLDNADFYKSEQQHNAAAAAAANSQQWMPVPNPDEHPDRYSVIEYDMDPGDVVAFHFRTCHGARGNMGSDRRRVLSIRYMPAPCNYIERPGPTSPPFHGHGMKEGDQIRNDWFPYV